jgi:hypothetical protein
MNENLIHSCGKLSAKKSWKTSSSDDNKGTEVQQATNLEVLFLIQLKCYGFAIFQIVSTKGVLIDIFYIEPFQILIKFFGTVLITAQPRNKVCSSFSASVEQTSRI